MPDALDWTIARCAEKQPSLRFANASELDRALAVCQRALKHPGQAVEVSLDNGQVISPSLQADDGSMSLVAPSLTRRLGAWSENTPLSTANVKNGSIGSDADWLDRDITVEPAADDAASSELDSGTSEVSSIVLPANRATPGWGTKAAVAALMIAAAGWAITSLQATPRTEAPPVVVTLPTLAAAAAPVVQAAPAPSAVAAVTPSTVAPAPSQLTESAASSTAAVDSDTKQAAPAKPKPAVAEKKPAPKPAPKPQAAAPKPAAPAPTKPAAAQPAAASPWVTKPEPKPRNDLKNPFQK
jgi:hypothetical protein